MLKKLVIACLLVATKIASAVEEPFGWPRGRNWWEFKNGEEYLAFIMLLSFLGVIYFLWHGLDQKPRKRKVIYLVLSTLCFIVMVIIGFTEHIVAL